MALPPISIVVICALSALDIILSLAVPFGLFVFGALSAGNSGVSSGFVLGAFLGIGWIALKIISLVGVLGARRWAIIVGAVTFSLPLYFQMASGWATLLSLPLGTALYLACTLPHWQRMTWRFP